MRGRGKETNKMVGSLSRIVRTGDRRRTVCPAVIVTSIFSSKARQPSGPPAFVLDTTCSKERTIYAC